MLKTPHKADGRWNEGSAACTVTRRAETLRSLAGPGAQGLKGPRASSEVPGDGGPMSHNGPLRSPRGQASALLDVSADWTDKVPKTSSPSPTYRSSESSLPWQQIRASLAAMARPAARIRQRLCFWVLRSSCRASRQGYQHVPYHQRKRQRLPAHRM
ncbi:hypothetical protein MRS44_012212 [Fusarium solani]|uniref:uncharacterized protein n=1 Tax=Fusarium solani TaxID=169388 RepID=UPI0032C46206|nr:hypothetical protein MRS44_012212 [Fusarium solani]